MAITPLQYEERYHKLTVSLDGLGTTTVDIHRYQNNDERLKSHEFWGNREALKHKDQVVGQLDADVLRERKEANAKPVPGEDKDDGVLPGVTDMDSYIREVGPKVAAEMVARRKAEMKEARAGMRAAARAVHLMTAEILQNQVRPTLMSVHSGKGSPEEIAAALYLVSKYKLYDKKFAGNPAAGVRDYADKYIGLDCNGFVGNYARAIGKLKDPDTLISEYAKPAARRTRIEDVQANDVMVWPDFGHITIIHSIDPLTTGPGGKPARDCRVVESTAGNPSGEAKTKHGGLQNSTYSIRSVAGTLFQVERPKGGGTDGVFIAPLS